MVLEKIIELEDRIIKTKRRLPKKIVLSNQLYCMLVKEMECNYYLSHLHGLPIQVLPVKKVIVE